MTVHTSELDLAMTMVLPHHDAEGVRYTLAAGDAHTAEVWAGQADFTATRATCEEAFAAAMTGLPVKRHRAFQVGNWTPVVEPLGAHHCHRNPELLPFMHKGERAYADAMGCTWMSAKKARQAIPPAYTEHIGRHLLTALESRAAA